jgi:uncharacterized protein YlxW (UPF0749 family)
MTPFVACATRCLSLTRVSAKTSNWRRISPLTFGLAGILFVASAHTSNGRDLRGGDHGDLVALIHSQQSQAARLTADVLKLSQQTQHLTRVQIDATLATQERLASAQSIDAGEIALTGPGAEVVLDDAVLPLGGPLDGLTIDDYVVHQQDVQGVVNALWAGGAEAMSINNQRISALTAIRCVGNTLLLAGRVYSPPYRIRAIGNQVRLRTALFTDPNVILYLQYSKAIGLRWSDQTLAAITLPAAIVPLTINYASLETIQPH